MAIGDPDYGGPSKGGIGHGDIGYGEGQVDPGLAAAAGSYGSGSGLAHSAGSASASGYRSGYSTGGYRSEDMTAKEFIDALKSMGYAVGTPSDAVPSIATPDSKSVGTSRGGHPDHGMSGAIDAASISAAMSQANAFDSPITSSSSEQSVPGTGAMHEAITGVSPDSAPVGSKTDMTAASEDANVSIAMGHPDFGMSGTAGPNQGTDVSGFIDPAKEAFREKERRAMGATQDFDKPRGPRDSFGNQEPIDQYGKVAEIENIQDSGKRERAYKELSALLEQHRQAQTPFGKALGMVMASMQAMSVTNKLGQVIDKALQYAGLTTDSSLNIIGQAIRAAEEKDILGPDYGVASMGHGRATGDGLPVQLPGIKQAIMQSEPWMRGLTERQIKWYLERPDQLNWVRNTWNELLGGQQAIGVTTEETW